MLGEAPEPPQFSGQALCRAWNRLAAQDRAAILWRVLDSALPGEIARERAAALRRAAALSPPASPFMLARALRARMAALAGAFPAYLDEGTADGCLAAALLIGRMRVPVERTIQRALESR